MGDKFTYFEYAEHPAHVKKQRGDKASQSDEDKLKSTAEGEDAENAEDAVEEISPEQAALQAQEQELERLKEITIRRANEEAANLLKGAESRANKLISEARDEAESIKLLAKQQGFEQGFSEGSEQGFNKAIADASAQLEKDSVAFLAELDRVLTDLNVKKQELLEEHISDMQELAVTVAEKVIGVSLRSSGKVIEKMILSVTENLSQQEWVKIYLSSTEAELLLDGDPEVFDYLSRLSEHIKVVVMDEAPEGTCIIEMPDETVDASVGVQIANIKEMMRQGG